eukprot:scaffold273814_cov86-Cyclotella_meneghiniana.AAC.3
MVRGCGQPSGTDDNSNLGNIMRTTLGAEEYILARTDKPTVLREQRTPIGGHSKSGCSGSRGSWCRCWHRDVVG